MHVDKTSLHMSVVMTSESAHACRMASGQQKAVCVGTGECRRRNVDVGVQCKVWEFQICIINDHGRLLGVVTTEGSSDDHREVCVCVYKGLLGTSQEHKVVYGSPNAWLSSLCACPHVPYMRVGA